MQTNSQIFQTQQIASRAIFKHAMSNMARGVLSAIMTAIIRRGSRFGNTDELLNQFQDGYQPSVYEDAILRWKADGIHARLGSGGAKIDKIKDHAEFITVCWLQPLFREQWGIDELSSQAWRFSSSASSTEIYNYIVYHFLLADFSLTELTKLASITREYSFDDIKSTCDKLTGVDQKSTSYLYKVLENSGRVERAQAKKQQVISDTSAKLIATLTQNYDKPKLVHKQPNPNWLDDVRTTKLMEDKLKNR